MSCGTHAMPYEMLTRLNWQFDIGNMLRTATSKQIKVTSRKADFNFKRVFQSLFDTTK